LGIVHFAAVGTRAGAVTSALAYIKHNPEQFAGFVGPNFDERIESVVVFVSPEVRNGHADKECVNNRYGSMGGPTWKNRSVIEYIKKFMLENLSDILPDKSSLCFCTIDPNDHEDCFTKIVAALLSFSEGEKQGKLVWCNITGGTNILNASLIQASLLSGRVGSLYYTFLSDIEKYGKYLSPPSEDKTIFDFRVVPFMKVNFDNIYYRILQIYEELDNPAGIGVGDIIGILRGEGISIDENLYRINYLLPMTGRELERIGSNNRVSKFGKRILESIKYPLLRALVNPQERTPENLQECSSAILSQNVWKEIKLTR
jgi:hypothetical protein